MEKIKFFSNKSINILLSFLLIATFAITSCSDDDDDDDSTALQVNYVDENAVATKTLESDTDGAPGDAGTNEDEDMLSGTYTDGDVIEVPANATVYLDGTVVFEVGSLLRINSGATIKSNADSEGLDTLIIKQGAKISANGTAAAPITFTSGEATPATGDWGGIVINGYAKINQGSGTAYGEGNSGLYGGNNDADSSGTLKYIRVYYAGFAFNSENELNGIALQGVGSGTTIDYVQLHRGKDDGIEMFGGTVNIKHIVSSANQDDQIDCTFGWRGKVQFGIALTMDLSGNDAAMEYDNNEDNYVAAPVTDVTHYNMTILSGGSKKGARMRRGTQATFMNSYFASVGSAKDTLIMSENLHSLVTFDYCVFENGSTTGYEAAGTDPDTGTLSAGSNVTSTTAAATQVDAADFADLTSLETAGASAFAQTGQGTGTTPPDDGFFDTSATFIGAVGTTNWLTGWTSFPAN